MYKKTFIDYYSGQNVKIYIKIVLNKLKFSLGFYFVHKKFTKKYSNITFL